jgi:hypothetical protein
MRLTLIVTNNWSPVMKTSLIAPALATTLAAAAIASPTAAEARWWHHGGFPVGPVVGGLAAGALIGAALAPRPYPYYAYDTGYVYEPVYYGPHCVVRRERIFDGWRWRFRSVKDCY